MGDWAVTYGVSCGLTAYNSMYIINYLAVKKRFTVWAAVSTCQELVELNQEVKWNIYFKAAIINIFLLYMRWRLLLSIVMNPQVIITQRCSCS